MSLLISGVCDNLVKHPYGESHAQVRLLAVFHAKKLGFITLNTLFMMPRIMPLLSGQLRRGPPFMSHQETFTKRESSNHIKWLKIDVCLVLEKCMQN